MKVQPELWGSAGRSCTLLPLLALIGCGPEVVSRVPQATATAARPSACDLQGAAPLPQLRLRAIGTEPFWNARIEGRCVTYSHPEDQAGTRVWTRFSGNASAGHWSGALNGRPFVLRTRAHPGCSDGMSDRRYPIAVSLAVGNRSEERRVGEEGRSRWAPDH